MIMMNKIHRLLHPEYKVFNFSASGNIGTYVASSVTGFLFEITQGSTMAERIGNRICTKSLMLDLVVTYNFDSPVNSPQPFRVVVVMDRDNIGSLALNASTLFNNTTGTALTTQLWRQLANDRNLV